MMETSLSQVLTDTLDARREVRAAAEQKLQNAETYNLPEFVNLLMAEFERESLDIFVRQSAAIRLKNCFIAKDRNMDKEKKRKWLELNVELRDKTKNTLLVLLCHKHPRIASTAGQLASLIAVIELPHDSWPTFIPALLRYVSEDRSGEHGGLSALTTLAYLCEEISLIADETGQLIIPECRINEILTAVVQGVRDERIRFKIEGTNALYHAIIFARNNLAIEEERNFIFAVLIENSKIAHDGIRTATFGCLVQIATEYYETLGDWMHVIGPITLEAIQGSISGMGQNSTVNPNTALAAMEFWTTIAEEELCMKESGEASRGYITAAIPCLLPIILGALVKQESEDSDTDTWTVSMAGGTCLGLISQLIGDLILEPIVTFSQANFNSTDWRRREAAVFAYGSMMLGPTASSLNQLLATSIPSLLATLSDPSVAVRDTAAWTVGRIASCHPKTIFEYIKNMDNHKAFFELILARLDDQPRVSVNVCWIINELYMLVRRSKETPNELGSALEPGQAEYLANITNSDLVSTLFDRYFETIAIKLLQIADRRDAEERSLRDGAFNALTAVITGVSLSCKAALMQLLDHLVQKLERSLRFDRTPSQKNYEALLCGSIQVLIIKLGHSARPVLGKLWICLMTIFTADTTESLSEDALLVASAIIAILQEDFEPCMKDFAPIIVRGLSQPDEVSTCKIVVELVGDCSRALGQKFGPYCQPILPVLFEILSDTRTSRSLKPSTMTAVGDVAMTLQALFSPFAESFLVLLSQAAATRMDMGPTNCPEWSEYFHILRDAVLQSYSSVAYGLRDGGLLSMLKPHVNEMLQLCSAVTNDEPVNFSITNFNSAIALVIDLVGVFGAQLVQHLNSAPFVTQMFNRAASYGINSETHGKAQLLTRALSSVGRS